MEEQNEQLQKAIELLNKNGYVVHKINKAQMAIAELCKHDATRCNYNLLGIKCIDLICVQDLIREQILSYIQNEE